MLIVRKKGQPLLDKYGLTMIYLSTTSRNSSTQYLTLLTGCGNTIATFSELAINTANVITEELDYAVELFGKWLDKNHETLTAFIETSKADKETNEAINKLNAEHKTFFTSAQYYANTKLETSYMTINHGKKTGIRYSVYGDGQLKVAILDKGSKEDLVSLLTKHKFTKVDECVQRMQLLWKKRQLEADLRQFRSDFNSCRV